MKLRSIFGFFVLAGASSLTVGCLQSASTGSCTTGVVETADGPVCGNLQTGGFPDGVPSQVETFVGIPFAADTGGENRFKPPQAVTPWDTTFEAVAFGLGCPQLIAAANPVFQPVLDASVGEDCLSINVWTPKASKSAKRPVMVFIYGGAFIEGSSNLPLMNGKNLAAGGDVVVVSMNYRVGAFGFMANNAWGAEGNYGIQDQQMALRWVNDNIAAFGGDPDKVMLFGESAGAMSVGIQQIAVGTAGENLFRASLMESNPYGIMYRHLVDSPTTAGSAPYNAIKIATDAAKGKCKDTSDAEMLDCLRGLTAAQILAAQGKVGPGFEFQYILPWTPVVSTDGVLRSQPNKEDFDVPVMMGTNTDEGVTFAIPVIDGLIKEGLIKEFNEEAYALVVGVFFGLTPDPGAIVMKAIEFYGPTAVGDDWTAPLYNLITDYIFTCATLDVYKRAKQDRFLYQFNQVASYDIEPSLKLCFEDSLVCHAFELPWVFGNGFSLAVPSLTDHFDATEAKLSTTMQEYWTQFTRELDPNRSGLPEWSQTVATRYQLLNTKITQAESVNAHCDYWDTVGYDVP